MSAATELNDSITKFKNARRDRFALIKTVGRLLCEKESDLSQEQYNHAITSMIGWVKPDKHHESTDAVVVVEQLDKVFRAVKSDVTKKEVYDALTLISTGSGFFAEAKKKAEKLISDKSVYKFAA